MTIQQLEYIVALAQHGHFSEAAFALNVSQPTLSATISKLESELDVAIFDRSKHPITPTVIGEKVIEQARITLSHFERITDIVHNEKKSVEGEVHVGIIPTVAPYLIPNFFTYSKKQFPDLAIKFEELPTEMELNALRCGDVDIAILATQHNDNQLLEIPLYKEELVVYASQGSPLLSHEKVETAMLSSDNLWVLRSEHCLSAQTLEICHLKKDTSACYTAGNIFTLINIIDSQGGYTIIPESHIGMLSHEQKTRVRHLAHPEPCRQVSLYIRKDYFKEGIINAIISCISAQVPKKRLNRQLLKGPVRI
ncbi:MAG: LysR family transcriptional regulator [Bacteroidales bacterium]|nr:LysR family transcriptional regulator [Bacteroidales bacterium]